MKDLDLIKIDELFSLMKLYKISHFEFGELKIDKIQHDRETPPQPKKEDILNDPDLYYSVGK